MELLLSLAMKFWMWTILIIVVIIGAIVNLFDKKKAPCYTYKHKKMPVLRPIPIKTKGKGFWKGILLWLLGVRHWELAEDFNYTLNDKDYVIPAGFTNNSICLIPFKSKSSKAIQELFLVNLTKFSPLALALAVCSKRSASTALTIGFLNKS